MDNISKETLLEKLSQYPTLLQQFRILLETEEKTLDDIEEILARAVEAETSATASANSASKAEKSASVAEGQATKAVSAVETEAGERRMNDNAIFQELVLEGKERKSADTDIQTNLSKEIETRKEQDTTLQTNIDTNWNLIINNLGIGRWRDVNFTSKSWLGNNIIYDNLAKYYTNCSYMFSGVSWVDQRYYDRNSIDVYFNSPTTFFGSSYKEYYGLFSGAKSTGAIYLPTMTGNFSFAFSGSQFSRVLVDENCEVMVYIANNGIFSDMPNLVEIGALDMSNYTGNYLDYFIQYSPKVKLIHCKHWRGSFNITDSIAFEEEGLVEIISNLDEVSTTKTLTMGSTNLAKLTDEEKKVATDKGWILA